MNIYELMNDLSLKEEFEKVVLDEVDNTHMYTIQVRCEVKQAYWSRTAA